MGVRHLARQRALQFLFALEYAVPDEPFAAAEAMFFRGDPHRRRGWGPFARQLARLVHEERAELDTAISGALQNWTLDRLPRIDRLCLRMALCELRHFPEIPLRVTINEYIEIARLFSTDDSPQYVNAVLDTLAREFKHKDFGGSEPGEPPQADETETP